MRFALVLAAALVVLPGCGGDDGSTETGPTATTTPTSSTPASPTTGTPTTATPSTAAGTVLTVASSGVGDVLFDESGQAIYLFDKETTSEPECYDECAEAWPPVLTEGSPQAAGGVRAQLLGTTQRTDGSTQVTYDGRPLYYYAHEGKNVVTCHNVSEYGGLWLAVTASGAPAD